MIFIFNNNFANPSFSRYNYKYSLSLPTASIRKRITIHTLCAIIATTAQVTIAPTYSTLISAITNKIPTLTSRTFTIIAARFTVTRTALPPINYIPRTATSTIIFRCASHASPSATTTPPSKAIKSTIAIYAFSICIASATIRRTTHISLLQIPVLTSHAGNSTFARLAPTFASLTCKLARQIPPTCTLRALPIALAPCACGCTAKTAIKHKPTPTLNARGRIANRAAPAALTAQA